MKRLLRAAILSAGLFLSSCAYVQTHKNVEEMSTYYEGHLLNSSTIGLYEQQGKWYLSAQRAKYKLSYPIVHDEVFRKSKDAPSFKLVSTDEVHTAYHPISDSAASILRRSDGYFRLNALAEEIQRTPGAWVDSLPSATKHFIAADLAGPSHFYMEDKRVPEEKPLSDRALGMIDFVLVDVPGTLIYNVAIPLMAPFVFFQEFLEDE